MKLILMIVAIPGLLGLLVADYKWRRWIAARRRRREEVDPGTRL
jgi:hypothetical protein